MFVMTKKRQASGVSRSRVLVDQSVFIYQNWTTAQDQKPFSLAVMVQAIWSPVPSAEIPSRR